MIASNEDDDFFESKSVETNSKSVALAAVTNPDDSIEEEKKESPDEMMLFLAKDGLYYNSYMEQRAANIRYNENKLRSVGLGSSFRLENKKLLLSTSPRKRSLSKRISSEKDDDTPRRKSGRIRQKQQIQSLSSPSVPTNSSPLLLDELPIDDTIYTRKNARKQKITRISSATGSHSTSTTTMTTNTLATNDRHILQMYEVSTPSWVQDMELYLKNVEHLSHPNYRSVMRQVDKLVTGTGITYTHWEEDVYFHRQAPISLSDDFDNLYNEALEFEIEHGRDLGNGTCCTLYSVFLFTFLQWTHTTFAHLHHGLWLLV